MESKGHEIVLLNREAWQHKIIIAVIASLLTLAIVFMVIIIRQKRNLDNAYKTLFEKNNRLIGIGGRRNPSGMGKKARMMPPPAISSPKERGRLRMRRATVHCTTGLSTSWRPRRFITIPISA